MALSDRFKGLMGIPEDEDFSSEEEIDFDELLEKNKKKKHGITKSETTSEIENKNSNDLVFTDNNTSADKKNNNQPQSQLQVALVKPESFAEASAIADHLNSKRTVVLNLESTNKDVSRRLVDFLSGVAYANGGQIKKVANSTYIITPYNVGVIGDSFLDELENNGVFF